MAEPAPGLAELRARVARAVSERAAPEALAGAAAERLGALLDLIAAGRGVREAGSGLNAASSELLVADALLTEAAARAALEDVPLDAIVRALELDALADRARALDEAAADRADGGS